jgi:hypothetical protein
MEEIVPEKLPPSVEAQETDPARWFMAEAQPHSPPLRAHLRDRRIAGRNA